MLIVLDRFPLPPSENMAYPTILRGGKSIRVVSKELRTFRKSVEDWSWERRQILTEARTRLAQEVAKGETALVKVDAYIGFSKQRLFTKDGRRKKLDASNRIKAMHDALSEQLCVDDRYFYPGVCEPAWRPEGEPECALIILTMKTMRAMYDVQNNLALVPKPVSSL